MKILHVSDTHGGMPNLIDRDSVDVIVHSGDLCPNKSFGIRPIEETFQEHWLKDNASRLRTWLGTDKPVLICPGNHDFMNTARFLADAGIHALWMKDGFYELNGVGFYGFPWTPVFYDWNYMCGPTEMSARLEPARDYQIDVFISHGPMNGILDRNDDGEHCGSLELRLFIQSLEYKPKLICHGHIHESAGFVGWSNGIRVSNAACTQRIIEI